MARPLAVLSATLLLGLAAAPVADAGRRSVPVGFYGAVWDREVASAPAAVQDAQWGRMAASGVESVRLVFSWAEAQPDPAAPPGFASTDPVVARATAHGIRLLPVVIYAPEWARELPERFNSPPARPDGYAAYLRALVGRYGPRGSFWAEHPELERRPVREWQVWNEPQLRFQWNGPDEDGDGRADDFERRYGELLRASYRALKQADGGAKVVLAAATNVSWEVLEDLYAKGGIGGSFDVAAVHPFTGSAARALRVVRLFRRVLRRHGDARTPLWVTELGFPAAKGRARSRSPLQVTDRGMAARLTRAYALLARRRRGRDVRVSRAYWYTWASSYAGDAIFDYAGLLRFDGSGFRARPALAAYRASARRHEGCAKTETGECGRAACRCRVASGRGRSDPSDPRRRS